MNTFHKKIALPLLGALLTLAGCQTTDPFAGTQTIPPKKTLVQIVTTDKNFSLLAQAVTRANLATALGGSNLTVFAPPNAAFAAAGYDSAAIAKADPTVLGTILKNHVLSTQVRSGDLQTGINQSVASLGGPVYVSKFNFGTPLVSVNGVRVTLADVEASNGIFHVIDNVILPATGTVVDVVKNNPNFTFLLAAVTRAGLVANLSGAGPITVFAPTDEAFKSTTSFKTIADINAATPAALAAILTYHVASGRVYSTNFVPEAYPLAGGIVVSSDAKKPGKIPTLAGTAVNISGDLKLTGTGNGTDAANIIRANISTTNGVVHVIDRVLLPG